MGRQMIPYPLPEDQMRDAMQGVINRVLAARWGVDQSTVWRWRRRLGVPSGTQGGKTTPAQQRILRLLATYPQGLMQIELTRRLGVSKQAASQTLRVLLGCGRVRWEPVPGLTRYGQTTAKRWFLVEETP